MNESSEFTGERFLPGIKNMQLALEHYQRYESVLGLTAGKIVLDAACGEGYGSQILSHLALQVTGIDISRETIAQANKKYVSSNLRFLAGDIAELPIDTRSVDVVVSFETIEHVSMEGQARFLAEIARVLKPDGLLVMSTPNRYPYNQGACHSNPYHVHEFNLDEFHAFLATQFPKIRIFHQKAETVNLIYQPSSEMTATLAGNHYQTAGTYLIAVACRDENQDLPALAHIAMPPIEQLQPVLTRILVLQDEVDTRNSHIRKLDQDLDDMRVRIVALQEEVRHRDVHLQALDAALDQARARILALQGEVEERNVHIQKLDLEISAIRNKP